MKFLTASVLIFALATLSVIAAQIVIPIPSIAFSIPPIPSITFSIPPIPSITFSIPPIPSITFYPIPGITILPNPRRQQPS